MKIIVCLKEVVDTKLSLDSGLTNEVLFQEGLPLRLNPDDVGAIAMALSIKQAIAGSQIEIILISIGPERVEAYLRQGLAGGADKAIRVWEENLLLSPDQKATILSRVISMCGADLILIGAISMDIGDGQVGLLMGTLLGLPCVNEAVRIELTKDCKSVNVIKDVGRGEREKLYCSLPAVITIKGEGNLPYASLDKFMESQNSEVKLLSLSDLGISTIEIRDNPTQVTGLSFPRPRTKKVITPDSSLPAFYRILKLLEGGISKRQGLILKGSNEELADQLFELLLTEGVIKPAKEL